MPRTISRYWPKSTCPRPDKRPQGFSCPRGLKVAVSAALVTLAASFVLNYAFRYYLNYNEQAFTAAAANYWTMRHPFFVDRHLPAPDRVIGHPRRGDPRCGGPDQREAESPSVSTADRHAQRANGAGRDAPRKIRPVERCRRA
jgi:hypothetical protein